jgi:hypothetical protein
MTPFHILFAKMLVKIFYMSLKYIHLLHVSTSLGHLQVTFYFKESIALQSLSLLLLSIPLYIYFYVLYCVLSSYCGCAVHHRVCRLSVLCVLCWFCVLCTALYIKICKMENALENTHTPVGFMVLTAVTRKIMVF